MELLLTKSKKSVFEILKIKYIKIDKPNKPTCEKVEVLCYVELCIKVLNSNF